MPRSLSSNSPVRFKAAQNTMVPQADLEKIESDLLSNIKNENALKVQQLEHSHKDLRENFTELEKELAREKAQIAELRTDKQTVIRDKQVLEKNIATLKMENTNLTEQLGQLQEKMRQNRILNENLMKRDKESTRKLIDYEAKLASIEQQWQLKVDQQVQAALEEQKSTNNSEVMAIEKTLFQTKLALVEEEKKHKEKVEELEGALRSVDQEAVRLDKEIIRIIGELKATEIDRDQWRQKAKTPEKN